MLFSVPEGEDKPLNYTVMFRAVQAVVVNKIDLLPYLDFSMTDFEAALRSVNPTAPVFPLSAKTGEGLEAWLNWLAPQTHTKQQAGARG
jgi:hydrogenase nickel incorporation protein HypB